jgi:hypothetical protein
VSAEFDLNIKTSPGRAIGEKDSMTYIERKIKP